jgi:hypothetical protein
MSTTNPTVGDLLAGKRRRLEQLLERRRTVGSAWAERISHSLSGVEDLTVELLLVEMAIADQWPNDVEVWMREWIVADATKLHDPAERRDDCSICVAFGAPSAAA